MPSKHSAGWKFLAAAFLWTLLAAGAVPPTARDAAALVGKINNRVFTIICPSFRASNSGGAPTAKTTGARTVQPLGRHARVADVVERDRPAAVGRDRRTGIPRGRSAGPPDSA